MMALVPLNYTIRSLFTRRNTTILTICSMGATVAVLAGVLSLQQGFATMFVERGRSDLAVLLRPGASSEGESMFPRDRSDILIKSSPEIALGKDGQPLASAEVYLAVRRYKVDSGETNVPMRGVQPKTFEIHGDAIKIIEGRNFEPGTDEVIIGKSLVGRIRNCQTGETIIVNTTPFKVVGVFDSKGAFKSEIWGGADRMLAALDRRNYSRLIAVLKDPKAMDAFAKRLESDKQVPAKVMDEKTYLESQTKALSITFVALGTLLAVIMGIAAVFTGTNAMLSALTARMGEVGILMSVGFRPFAIFLAFQLEAIIIGLAGGLLGCLLILPLNGIQTGTTNFATFTEVAFAFQTTPLVLAVAIGFSIFLGLFGGAIPAIQAARMKPTEALRRV